MFSPPPKPRSFDGLFETGEIVRAAYSEGAGPLRIVPSAVAVPANIADLVSLIRHAKKEGLSLTPRGAGSAMPGGNIGPGIVVDLSKFDAASIDSVTSIARVGAATTYKRLDEMVCTVGSRLPPDPSSAKFCTLGGMIATNAAGPRSLKYGSIRNWVSALQIVTADGEVATISREGSSDATAATARFEQHVSPEIDRHAVTISASYPKTTKNSAGYALDKFLISRSPVDLIIGSEGTLAFVVSAQLRLSPIPTAVGALLLTVADLDALSALIPALISFHPSALELMDRSLLKYATARIPSNVSDAAALLIAEYEAENSTRLEELLTEIQRKCAHECTSIEAAADEFELHELWTVRHAASSALANLPETKRSLQIIEDGCVPVEKLADYLNGIHRAAEQIGIEVVAFGHAGDGHVHVNALADTTDPDLTRRLSSLLDAVTDLVLSLDGSPSGEHGDGRMRAGLLQRMYGPEVFDLFTRVKSAFDPDNILNPGVIVPIDAEPIFENLKVGAHATPIPEVVASRLRRIEREAGWGPAIEFVQDLSP
ncbi:MAG: FAD-binding oxidoreductase [Gemmatimonadetes bacterium]|nr:FAD-binding oxidoreductase [Gemmatimonadota bacterium]